MKKYLEFLLIRWRRRFIHHIDSRVMLKVVSKKRSVVKKLSTNYELKVNKRTYEQIILDAIREAKKRNVRIIRIGLTNEAHEELKRSYFSPIPGELRSESGILEFPNQIGRLFGVPIEITDKLQITTEIPRFLPL